MLKELSRAVREYERSEEQVQATEDDSIIELHTGYRVHDSRQHVWLSRVATDAEQLFDDLAEEWREGTRLSSSFTDLLLHHAYQRIIGMGPVAIPLILRELERDPAHWFWALNAITGEDPVAPEDAGRLQRMTGAWLDWGRAHGHI